MSWGGQASIFRCAQVLIVTAFLLMPLASTTVAQEVQVPLSPARMREIVPLIGGTHMLLIARSLGMTEIKGKSLDLLSSALPPARKAGKPSPKPHQRNVGIGVDPVMSERTITVVTHPQNRKHLVAGNEIGPFPVPGVGPRVRCAIYISDDSGRTFSGPVVLPHLLPLSHCSEPVLAYAPDGTRLYAAYEDIKLPPGSGGSDVVVSHSDDGGQTWTGPVIVFDSTNIVFYFKPWIAVHEADPSQGNWVYVTATRESPPRCGIDVVRSSTHGASWTAPLAIVTPPLCGAPFFTLGSNVAGGVGAHVLVAWWDPSVDNRCAGAFRIRTSSSADHGASWIPALTAVEDFYEATFILGPLYRYHEWGEATMFPRVAIDPDNRAHVVYTHDPEPNQVPFCLSTTAEDGDIRYITSAGPPYASWSAPVTINDDGLVRAQGYPAVTWQRRGKKTSIHVIWEDHRLSPTDNLTYDIFYASRETGPRDRWSANIRLTDVSSTSSVGSIGIYNGIAANRSLRFGAWTDRRHQTSIFATETNTFGTRIGRRGALR